MVLIDISVFSSFHPFCESIKFSRKAGRGGSIDSDQLVQAMVLFSDIDLNFNKPQLLLLPFALPVPATFFCIHFPAAEKSSFSPTPTR